MEYKTPAPPQASYEEPASNQQAQFAIEPCAAILRHDGNFRSGMFHLLKCGHIVAIDGGDTRCGINCQETANSAQSSTFLTTRDLLSLPEVQRPDFLYCEVCQGIPWDNYRRMQPPSDDLPRSTVPMPRRCIGFTRGEIVAAIRVPQVGVEALLASPFPSSDCYAHNLCCGHRVWCAYSRNCARNCNDDWPCNEDGVRRLLMKQADIIFCEECVFRAERVHAKWGAAAAARGVSLDLTFGHQPHG